MPIYQYQCEEHGEFEDIKNVSERKNAKCPECQKDCELVVSTNEFAAKTRYIPPPKAKKVLGEKNKVAHIRPRWH